jgi:3-oxoacyl-[acyl-carrier-protein] synthase III
MMTDDVGVGSFAYAVGELEGKPADIPGFDTLWQSVSPQTDFATMGCETFRKMSGPPAPYVVDAVRRTLRDAGAAPTDVSHIVFATSDPTLARLPHDFAIGVLDAAGLTGCVPHLVSFQRCCSSQTALRHARHLFADPAVRNVLMVALDFTPDDRDRVRNYALFGDGAASCLLTRDTPGLVRLVSSAIHVDEEGLRGRDSILSRKEVADQALASVLAASGRRLEQITQVFPANLHQPLMLFNAAAAGLRPDRLHYADTLAAYGHCGNADWMINLADYHEKTGIVAGQTYLAQAPAQGFHACSLLEGSA